MICSWICCSHCCSVCTHQSAHAHRRRVAGIRSHRMQRSDHGRRVFFARDGWLGRVLSFARLEHIGRLRRQLDLHEQLIIRTRALLGRHVLSKLDSLTIAPRGPNLIQRQTEMKLRP